MSKQQKPNKLSIEAYRDGLLEGDRAVLARAITLIESSKTDHQKRAQHLLQCLLGEKKKAHHIGITGVPGVGKSTVIEALGSNLTAAGHRVAVLAVDPTSQRSGGSILGDKTRMHRLATDPNAFIRPSPTSGTLGGVARKTRETMALCEAAGYDIIIVETVGVGQSETAVAGMVDFFLVLMLPGAGDELQGIKKGVLEIADMIAVNKAEEENALRARQAASEYRSALHILTPSSPNWSPPVLTISGLKNQGLDEMWALIISHKEKLTQSGEFQQRRQTQQVKWMHDMLEDRLMHTLRDNPSIVARLPVLEEEVRKGALTPALAVDEIAGLMKLSH